MVTYDLISELAKLRDQWLENANHLDKTIELLKANLAMGGSNGLPKSPIIPMTGYIAEKVPANGTPLKKGVIPGFNTMSIDERIIAIIKHENRFLFRAEIEGIAIQLGKPFKNMIASSISGIRKRGEAGLALYKIEHNQAVWGFESWLDDNGIKPEHMYKPKSEEVMA